MNLTEQRIDKWLWATRFYKTRALATAAVNGGKVHLNKQRVKAGHTVKVDDILSIQKESGLYELKVLSVVKTRRPAKEAIKNYEEFSSSIEKRKHEYELKKLANAARPTPQKKPNKRHREQLRQFKQNNKI